MAGCSLVLAFDTSFESSSSLTDLLRLSYFRQVVQVNTTKDLHRIDWTPNPCAGYFFLLGDSASTFLTFAGENQHAWDYDGKYVFVGFSVDELNDLTKTMKGRKTEHIAGIIKGQRPGEYTVYMNQLYWAEGMTWANTWRRNKFFRPVSVFPDKISDLRQAVLNVVAFELPPNIIYHRRADGSLLIYGLEVELVRALAQAFNFTIEFKEPPPGEMWGEQLPNGSYNGLVGMLGSGEGDLGIANKYITSLYGRLEFEHYSAPYEADKSCYLARMEPPLPRWQSLGLPFQLVTWLAILAGLVLSGPVLFALARASVGPSGSDTLGAESLTYACVYILGIHFRISQRLIPRHASIRVLVVFLWMYAIILTTGYSSNLTAFLTVSRQPPSIQTIKALRESNFKVFGVGPFFGNSMASSENPHLRALAERFVPMTSFSDITTEVLKGQGVMIQSGVFLKYMGDQLTTSRGLQRVRVIKECFSPYSVGIGLQSYSPLIRKFNRVINWIVQSGLFRHWHYTTLRQTRKFKIEERRRSDANAPAVDEVPRDTGVIPLGIDHLQGIFLVLLFGYLLSVLAFVVEKSRTICCQME